MQALPVRLSVQVLQAPLTWLLPMRKESPLRPPFKVAVDVESAQQEAAPPPSVHPHILTEEELLLGVPPDAGAPAPWRAAPLCCYIPLHTLCLTCPGVPAPCVADLAGRTVPPWRRASPCEAVPAHI